jgi:uncharacterized protein YndB with AHSA1/START domain
MMTKVLLAAGILVLLVVIAPLFLKSKVSMSRSIEIDAPLTKVFSTLTDLNEYAKWNPFPEGDPTNRVEISGAGLGSFLSWKGTKTGEGKMTIVKIEPEQKISVKMEFFKPMTGEGMVYWITSAKSDLKTELVWKFEQDLSYFSRYFGLMMNSMMGGRFEKGLLNYKTLVEGSK